MKYESLGVAAIVGLVASFAADRGWAAFSEDFEALLAQGKTRAAAELAEGAVGLQGNDDQARFALGTAQFLMSVEHLTQGLYRYGLRSVPVGGETAGLIGLPFLRLPVPENPTPEPVSYDALNGILEGFVTDLAIADATLAQVSGKPFDLMLRLDLVTIDIDGDGVGSPEESLGILFNAVTGGRSSFFAGRSFPVGFDQSDATWLRGYTHLLRAMAELPLAHDWHLAFESTFHGVFPNGATPSIELDRETLTARELLRQEKPRFAYSGKWTPEINEKRLEWEKTPEGQLAKRMSDAENVLFAGGIADMIAFLHLFNWPVIQPERMQNVREHLLQMVALSRESWRSILAETDDNHEWVPGPKQTSILRRMSVTEARLEGWTLFLDEFEAVLNGEKLIPHWRFDSRRGVNLKRMFEEPRTLDLVMLAQGYAALPYLEEGDLVQVSTVETVLNLMEGGFMRYFIWFN